MFVLENLGLKSVDVKAEGTIENQNAAYIISQNPPADGTVMEMEATLQIFIQQLKPGNCL
jgi:hypothetical protein